jgi:hypothetical protein
MGEDGLTYLIASNYEAPKDILRGFFIDQITGGKSKAA